MELSLEERHACTVVQHDFLRQLRFHLFLETDNGIWTCEHRAQPKVELTMSPNLLLRYQGKEEEKHDVIKGSQINGTTNLFGGFTRYNGEWYRHKLKIHLEKRLYRLHKLVLSVKEEHCTWISISWLQETTCSLKQWLLREFRKKVIMVHIVPWTYRQVQKLFTSPHEL